MTGEALRSLSVRVWLLAAILLAATGCAGTQIHSTTDYRAFSLKKGDLPRYGIAFITPSTVTGQEEERQAVALIFAAVMARDLPGVRIVTLPETLSEVNGNGLADEYRKMYADSRATGIFLRATLKKIGEISGARYVAQIKLAGFSQGSMNRWGFLGIRIVDTQFAKIRLFFQIWDSADGSIAWEGTHELVYAEDAVSEKGVTLKRALEYAAAELVHRLPDWVPPPKKPSAATEPLPRADL
jgi:hypothetical protein